jgi:hypothetical protein
LFSGLASSFISSFFSGLPLVEAARVAFAIWLCSNLKMRFHSNSTFSATKCVIRLSEASVASARVLKGLF